MIALKLLVFDSYMISNVYMWKQMPIIKYEL